ncbi:MAG: hypothetical protein IT578_08275, partial [Verrucomicrobiae bacterium]|nr:hypothetical protein [Verrucomicrobiae bacterium]
GKAGYKSEINCGSYGINEYLLQCGNPPDPMWQTRVGLPYPDESKVPMVLETGAFGVTGSWTHQSQALNGVYGASKLTEGRSHGKGDMLNFVFVDGHAECISRNDPRPLAEADKSWLYPTNPNGAFASYGRYGKYASHSALSSAQYDAAYP